MESHESHGKTVNEGLSNLTWSLGCSTDQTNYTLRLVIMKRQRKADRRSLRQAGAQAKRGRPRVQCAVSSLLKQQIVAEQVSGMKSLVGGFAGQNLQELEDVSVTHKPDSSGHSVSTTIAERLSQSCDLLGDRQTPATTDSALVSRSDAVSIPDQKEVVEAAELQGLGSSLKVTIQRESDSRAFGQTAGQPEGQPQGQHHCHLCSSSCPTLQAFQNHMMGTEHQKRLKEVTQIVKTAGSRGDQPIKPRWCDTCQKHFTGDVILHRRTNQHKLCKQSSRPYCLVCKRHFRTPRKFVEHMKSPEHKQKVLLEEAQDDELITVDAIGCFEGEERSGEERSGEERSGEERFGEERPGEERSGGERSGEERSGEERSGGERSGEERSGEERSGEERSGGERSGEERSGEERSGEERFGEERSGEERLGGERSGEERPGEERPGEERLGGERSGEERPGEERSGEERSGEERSGGERLGGERLGGERLGEEQPGEERSVEERSGEEQSGEEAVVEEEVVAGGGDGDTRGGGEETFKGEETEKQEYDPDTVYGSCFVVPVTGFLCRLCQKFFDNEATARHTHCRTHTHFLNLQMHQTSGNHGNLTQEHTSSTHTSTAPNEEDKHT